MCGHATELGLPTLGAHIMDVSSHLLVVPFLFLQVDDGGLGHLIDHLGDDLVRLDGVVEVMQLVGDFGISQVLVNVLDVSGVIRLTRVHTRSEVLRLITASVLFLCVKVHISLVVVQLLSVIEAIVLVDGAHVLECAYLPGRCLQHRLDILNIHLLLWFLHQEIGKLRASTILALFQKSDPFLSFLKSLLQLEVLIIEIHVLIIQIFCVPEDGLAAVLNYGDLLVLDLL